MIGDKANIVIIHMATGLLPDVLNYFNRKFSDGRRSLVIILFMLTIYRGRCNICFVCCFIDLEY